MKTLADYYRRNRREHPDVPARWAFAWAQSELAVDRLSREVEWTDVLDSRLGVLAIGRIDDSPVEIVVYDDPEPYDWGDIEPSDEERRDLNVIGVGVNLAGEAVLDSIWGVGFTHGDFEREALRVVLDYGFLDTAKRELAERAEWAARDTVTV